MRVLDGHKTNLAGALLAGAGVLTGMADYAQAQSISAISFDSVMGVLLGAGLTFLREAQRKEPRVAAAAAVPVIVEQVVQEMIKRGALPQAPVHREPAQPIERPELKAETLKMLQDIKTMLQEPAV